MRRTYPTRTPLVVHALPGERGGVVIYGRSDSTINRQGVRMGSSEIYRVVEALPEILDSLVIDLEGLGGESTEKKRS